MKDAVGFGALNVDLIYEVESFEFLKKEGINYELNGEVEGEPKDFRLIHEKTGAVGLLKKSKIFY